MRLPRSITFRASVAVACLTAALLVGVTVLLISVLVTIGDPDKSPEGSKYAVRILREAIDRDAEGRLVLRAGKALVALEADRPFFWYVVRAGDETVSGGPAQPPAGAWLQGWAGRIDHAQFEYVVGERRLLGYASSEETRAGPVTIELGGVTFSLAEELLFGFGHNTPLIISYGVFVLLVMIAAVWAIPRLIARPVRVMAAAAEAIDGLPAGRRLPAAQAPAELKPLAGAFNRALERIDDAAEAQRTFLSNAAHELRTPLTRMRMRLERVRDIGLRAELIADVQRLSGIVATLLHLARLSGRPLTQARVDLVALARTVVAEQVPAALAAGTELALEAPRPVAVAGSEMALRLALTNLVENAVRHGGGLVTVSVAHGEIAVTDRGAGVPEGLRAEVMKPFARAGAGAGAGLGLAIVAQVMALHGGSVTIGEAEEGGARVALLFPKEALVP